MSTQTKQETVTKPTTKRKTRRYLQQVAIFPVSVISSLLSVEKRFTVTLKTGKTIRLKVNKLRFSVFAKSPTCACCGRTGTLICLDRRVKVRGPHRKYRGHVLNFYAVEGKKLIPMTVDHILPKSLGGPDHITNFQTLCFDCNAVKGNNNITNGELRKLIKQRSDWWNDPTKFYDHSVSDNLEVFE